MEIIHTKTQNELLMALSKYSDIQIVVVHEPCNLEKRSEQVDGNDKFRRFLVTLGLISGSAGVTHVAGGLT